MMIVVAIVSILAAVAVPNLRSFFINNRLDTASNELMTALSFARSEAIRRGVTVTIRKLSPAPRDWTSGWEVFVDVNANGVRDVADPREELLRSGQPLASPVTLFASGPIATYVPFAPDGRIPLAIDALPPHPQAILMVCYEGVAREGIQSRSRALLLSGSGRARSAVDANNNGLPENAGGVDISNCSNPA